MSRRLSPEDRGRQAAQVLRDELGLDDAPVADMVDLVERRGECDVAIEVMADGVDGMVATDPESGHRVIAVATSDLLHRQRFTLAHELGHLEQRTLSEHTSAGARSAAEIEADAFARHLLLPCSAVRRLRGLAVGLNVEEALSELVRLYRVSPMVAAIQMRDVGWTDSVEIGQCHARGLATRFGWRSEYDAWAAEARLPRPPRRLMRRTVDAYVAGAVSIAAVASVAGISVEQAQAQLDTDNIRPVPAPITWFDPDA